MSSTLFVSEDHPLLEGLTAPQREAVLHDRGPLLVLAAAGSGKTRVITRRIARLIAQGVPAHQILALTFTNKAAGEMRERAQKLLGEGALARGLTVTTFHALGARLLRQHAQALGRETSFTIYDSDDQLALAKRVLANLQLASSNWPPRSVLGAISAAKNKLATADQYASYAQDFYHRTIARAYKGYETALREAGAVDFDDLLLLTARLLGEHEEVRQQVRGRWRYILIDEYQDTNHAQLRIAELLTDPAAGSNICVVGDPDQAIYGWRGADIGNILEFETHFPGARVIMLGENFRSRAPILAVADTLIKHNAQRKPKPLFTSRQGGEKIELVTARDERHEASLAVDWLEVLHKDKGIPWREMAVFYRTNSLSRVLEEALRTAAIPYIIARGTAFYEREEIKHALAYLRLLVNPADTIALDRIINVPGRGIGQTSLERVEAFARASGISFIAALGQAGSIEGLTPKAAAAIARFLELLNGWRAMLALPHGPEHSLSAVVERLIRESGLEKMYREQQPVGDDEGNIRLENLAELVSSARQFELEQAEEESTPTAGEVLAGFLESVALVADADRVDPEQGVVTLMTLHAAKGLEFDAVAIVGLEEGLLPHQRALDDPSQLEEERRLCFVGITRAKERLLMTSCALRTVRGTPIRTIPSRFLDELPAAHILSSNQAHGPESFDERESRWIDRDEGHAAEARVALPVGSWVRHPQFGEGEVTAVKGQGPDARATVRFRTAGLKTLVLEYARLTRIR